MGSHVLPTTTGADKVSRVIVRRLSGPQASRILSLLLRCQCEHSSHPHHCHDSSRGRSSWGLTPPHLTLAYLSMTQEDGFPIR